MNPRVVALIVFGGIVALCVLVAVFVWWVGRRAGVNRGELRRTRRELESALDALDQIQDEADKYQEIDSVLAGLVKEIIKANIRQRREISR